jgi:hypothetical protein
MWLFKIEFLMLVALGMSHLLLPAALTSLDYHYTNGYGVSEICLLDKRMRLKG